MVSNPEFAIDGVNVEGFVVEDATHFMVKLKLSYYRNWKVARSIKESILKGKKNFKLKGLDKDVIEFINWIQTLERAELKTDIITLRSNSIPISS